MDKKEVSTEKKITRGEKAGAIFIIIVIIVFSFIAFWEGIPDFANCTTDIELIDAKNSFIVSTMAAVVTALGPLYFLTLTFKTGHNKNKFVRICIPIFITTIMMVFACFQCVTVTTVLYLVNTAYTTIVNFVSIFVKKDA